MQLRGEIPLKLLQELLQSQSCVWSPFLVPLYLCFLSHLWTLSLFCSPFSERRSAVSYWFLEFFFTIADVFVIILACKYQLFSLLTADQIKFSKPKTAAYVLSKTKVLLLLFSLQWPHRSTPAFASNSDLHFLGAESKRWILWMLT